MNIVSNKPTITRKEIEGVLDCLVNGELVSGNTVKNFETDLSTIVKLRHSLATNSSSSAYHLAFIALDIGNEDEVIIPSYFDLAPLSALTLTGALPVIVDIEEKSFAPSIEQIKKKINAEMISIFGIGGRLKGLPLIYACDDGIDLKQFSARLYEVSSTINVAKPIGVFLLISADRTKLSFTLYKIK